jgi:hypothetical protein
VVKYSADEHDEGQDKNDDAVENRYADAIAVGLAEAWLIAEFGDCEISFR